MPYNIVEQSKQENCTLIQPVANALKVDKKGVIYPVITLQNNLIVFSITSLLDYFVIEETRLNKLVHKKEALSENALFH